MPPFRKKPVKIEAIQWTEENADEIKLFVGMREDRAIVDGVSEALIQGECRFLLPSEITGVWEQPHVYDEIQATWVTVFPDDWIIKGIKGEFYPCADDVFQQTYEPVDPYDVGGY